MDELRGEGNKTECFKLILERDREEADLIKTGRIL
jgi:hypothetical protein